MARVLDRQLGNGDQHELQFSSGAFVDHLHRAIISNDTNLEARFAGADTYIFASYQRMLALSMTFYDFVSQTLTSELTEARSRAQTSHASLRPYDGEELLLRARTAANEIRAIGIALAQPSDETFTGQAERSIVATQELIDCSKAMQFQIDAYKETIANARNLRRTIGQNRAMIFWGASGTFIAIIALIVALIGLDSNRLQALIKFVRGN